MGAGMLSSVVPNTPGKLAIGQNTSNGGNPPAARTTWSTPGAPCISRTSGPGTASTTRAPRAATIGA